MAGVSEVLRRLGRNSGGPSGRDDVEDLEMRMGVDPVLKGKVEAIKRPGKPWTLAKEECPQFGGREVSGPFYLVEDRKNRQTMMTYLPDGRCLILGEDGQWSVMEKPFDKIMAVAERVGEKKRVGGLNVWKDDEASGLPGNPFLDD